MTRHPVEALTEFFRSSDTAMVYRRANCPSYNKTQKWAVSSWVPGFINLPGHVMARTAAKKPGLHVNIIPQQVLGSTNRAARLQAVLSASTETTSCETIWAGMAVILEFHQEGL